MTSFLVPSVDTEERVKGSVWLALLSGKLHVSEEKPAFSERDRELFLEICGVKRLSQCVTTEAQTEIYRPCPTMQALVHELIPYVQRFIYFHEELREIYEELKENGIAQEVKSLSFGQVGARVSITA